MTKSELKPLYVEACTRARTKPQISEEAVWFSKLGYLDIADLKAAIDAHFEKSQWMPKESELKPLAEHAKHSRHSQASAKTTYARYSCPDCGATRGGFIEPNDYNPRRCYSPYRKFDDRKPFDASLPPGQVCGALMIEVMRQDNFETGNKRAGNEERPAEAKWDLPPALAGAKR